ncbi:MAG: DUF2252 domain-containing protein [Acidimicrobiales bacterium]
MLAASSAGGPGATTAGTRRRRKAVHAYSTVAERTAAGRAARLATPRSSLGEWAPAGDRRDPVAVLEDQERTRVPELVPIRHGRMASSPFAFYRGAAAVMAADLAAGPRSGLEVQLCGDAHLVNFGGFASPDRDLVFDVNDFDETHPGPFEWDVMRLAASFEVAGRERGFDDAMRQDAVQWAARSYREAVREFGTMTTLDVWYSRLDLAGIERRWGAAAGGKAVRNLQRLAAKAESKNHLKAFDRLTRLEGGELRFASDPPLLVPVSELFSDVDATRLRDTVAQGLAIYRDTLNDDRRRLIDRYRFVDLARKVVGVGSVGTRCWVSLLVGRDEGDPLFLQVKEAEGSVLEPYVGRSAYANHGQRVVEGQRLMQAASDIMLGWTRTVGVDDVTRDFYMRQLWDWKVSASVETMLPGTFHVYAQICGWTLARAHARSGDAAAIGAYLGTGNAFDRAMVAFARAYADQNERDHGSLVAAIADGRVVAEAGV